MGGGAACVSGVTTDTMKSTKGAWKRPVTTKTKGVNSAGSDMTRRARQIDSPRSSGDRPRASLPAASQQPLPPVPLSEPYREEFARCSSLGFLHADRIIRYAQVAALV
ncbi:hypothetical protein E2C01_003672 [Portunus trituberculatus]|uniref:Uncharacterized protein n=1 Tax=Portunus trituberculatus TaxID=210409 RepID=A0A5B7CNK6_PORTR|nr:hypothetical protein [Portunus trituberculatus]